MRVPAPAAVINATNVIAFSPGGHIHFEWLLSRIYCLLNRPEAALHHALECKKWTERGELKDFDLAFNYESLARAYACNQMYDQTTIYCEKATDAGNAIEKKEDKDYFFEDFKGGMWFGFNHKE